MRTTVTKDTTDKREDLLWYLLSAILLPFQSWQYSLIFTVGFYLAKFIVSRLNIDKRTKHAVTIYLFIIFILLSLTGIGILLETIFNTHIEQKDKIHGVINILGISVTLIQSVRLVVQAYLLK